MITQGIQSRSSNAELRTFGCFYYCIAKIAEVVLGRNLREDLLENWFYYCKRKGWIGDSAMILDHAAVFNFLLGPESNGNAYCKSFNQPDVDCYIEENWKTGKDGKLLTHFTAMINGVKFDPLDPNRPTNTGYSVHTYRWFE